MTVLLNKTNKHVMMTIGIENEEGWFDRTDVSIGPGKGIDMKAYAGLTSEPFQELSDKEISERAKDFYQWSNVSEEPMIKTACQESYKAGFKDALKLLLGEK